MINFRDLATDLLLEYSPNDRIPELNRKKKGLAIILIGSAASGKTNFLENFIMARQPRLKVFSTDKLSKLRIKRGKDFPHHPDYKGKEPGEDYASGTSGLRNKYIRNFLEASRNKENFVVDTTGIEAEKSSGVSETVRWLYKLIKKMGYDVIFIQLLSTLYQGIGRAVDRNQKKDQPDTDYSYLAKTYSDTDVDPDLPEDWEDYSKKEKKKYLRRFFRKHPISSKKVQSIMRSYASLGDDSYYIVYNSDEGSGRYRFMKYEDGEIKVWNGSEYVPVSKR